MKLKSKIIILFLLLNAQAVVVLNAADTAKVAIDTSDVLKGLDLKKVPDVATLHKVAKKYFGKWSYLFLAIKIEESGNNGHYSWLSTTHFNLCGMRYPKSRRTYAVGSTNTNYAIFRNWFECMLDFKLYLDNIEAKYIAANNKPPKDEFAMIDYMFNSFNHFDKWKKDMVILTKYVKKKYK